MTTASRSSNIQAGRHRGGEPFRIGGLRRLGALSTYSCLIALGAACGDGELNEPSQRLGDPMALGNAGSSAGNGGSSGVAAGVTPRNGSDGVTPIDPQLGGVGNPSAGAGGASSSGAGGSGNAPPSGGSAGSGAPLDCDVVPAPSTLEGWAAVAGSGVPTTTGGGNATPVVVTTLAQLSDAVEGSAPAVIHVRGKLAPGDIAVGSNKTIIGLCGAEIHGHLELRESVNVIIRNLTLVGYGEGNCTLDPDFDAAVGCSSGADGVTIQRNSHHVWVDHCSVRDGTDGNLDITNGANFVTVSYTKFSYTPRTDNVGNDSTGASGHRYSNLVGGSDSPDDFDDANALNVTWHHNWWADNVVERQPRIRFGQNHLYNNYYSSDSSNYCIRAGIQASVLVEGNVFDGVDDAHEFNSPEDEATANIALGSTNIYSNTTSDKATGGGGPAFTDPPYDYSLDPASAVAAAVASAAGPH